MARCGKCGKSLPNGDKMAEIGHKVSCPKTVRNAGLYQPFKTDKQKKEWAKKPNWNK